MHETPFDVIGRYSHLIYAYNGEKKSRSCGNSVIFQQCTVQPSGSWNNVIYEHGCWYKVPTCLPQWTPTPWHNMSFGVEYTSIPPLLPNSAEDMHREDAAAANYGITDPNVGHMMGSINMQHESDYVAWAST